MRVLPWGVGKHQLVWFFRMSQWQFLVPLPQSGRMKNTRNHINWQNLNFLLLSQSWNWKICQNQFPKVLRSQNPKFLWNLVSLVSIPGSPCCASSDVANVICTWKSGKPIRISLELNSGKVETLEFGRIYSHPTKIEITNWKNPKNKNLSLRLTIKLQYDFLKVISEVIHISQVFFKVKKKSLPKKLPRVFSSVRLGSVGTSWLSGPSGPSKDSWSFNLNSPGREKTVLGGSSQLVSGSHYTESFWKNGGQKPTWFWTF